MHDSKCAHCAFRARYDSNPKSILGRLWRWHAGWCPGWKKFMKSLPDMEKMEMIRRYRLNPEKFIHRG